MSNLPFWLLGAALIAALVAYFRGRVDGAELQRAKEADAYEDHLKDIADAANARAGVRTDDGLQDDKYRRD